MLSADLFLFLNILKNKNIPVNKNITGAKIVITNWNAIKVYSLYIIKYLNIIYFEIGTLYKSNPCEEITNKLFLRLEYTLKIFFKLK